MVFFNFTKTGTNVTVGHTDPFDIYCAVVEDVYGEDLRYVSETAHMAAADAQGWCELACVGDVYKDNGFTIVVNEE